VNQLTLINYSQVGAHKKPHTKRMIGNKP
jgi:hypothetical protein